MMYTINRFEWDDGKARSNALKHGVGFKEAATAFHDSAALVAEDSHHSQQEQRHWLIGETANGRLIVVVFVVRSESAIRLISARPATNTEKTLYEENKGISF